MKYFTNSEALLLSLRKVRFQTFKIKTYYHVCLSIISKATLHVFSKFISGFQLISSLQACLIKVSKVILHFVLKFQSKIYALFFSLFFCFCSQASIWIKAYSTENYKFKAHLLNLGKEHQSFSKHLLKRQKEQMESFKIKDKTIQAQSYYLSGDLKPALKIFKKITDIAFKADWNQQERRAIFYSFLRLAQNEDDKDRRAAFLLSASQFIIDAIDKSYPDYNLFPPSLWKQFYEIQKNQTFLSLSWKDIFPHHDMIFLNGRPVSFDEDNKLAEASYRITALSSSHAPWIKVRSLSFLINQKIKTKSLTFGSCKNLRIKDYWNQKGLKLFKEPCQQESYLGYAQKKSKKTNGKKENLASFSQKSKKEEVFVFKNKPNISLQSFYKSFPEGLKFKKENRTQWFIIAGASVVLASVLFYKSNQKKKAQGDIHW